MTHPSYSIEVSPSCFTSCSLENFSLDQYSLQAMAPGKAQSLEFRVLLSRKCFLQKMSCLKNDLPSNATGSIVGSEYMPIEASF